MAFTDENTLRTHLGGIEIETVSSEQVLAAMDAAHGQVLRDLKEEFLSSEDESLKLAETELAAAFLLRMLAGRHAVERPDMQSSMIRPDGGEKVEGLLSRAEEEERRGRGRLQPFLEQSEEGFGFVVTPGEADREDGE
jgi:hypothetical protein